MSVYIASVPSTADVPKLSQHYSAVRACRTNSSGVPLGKNSRNFFDAPSRSLRIPRISRAYFRTILHLRAYVSTRVIQPSRERAGNSRCAQNKANLPRAVYTILQSLSLTLPALFLLHPSSPPVLLLSSPLAPANHEAPRCGFM